MNDLGIEPASHCCVQPWPMDPFGPPCSNNSRDGGMHGLDDDFYCYRYKIDKCATPTGHIWRNCPFVHAGEPVQRRHPSRHLPDICPRIKQGQMCPDGPHECKYAHNAFEAWLHPERYKTLLCHQRSACKRSTCFFAHSEAELRLPTKARPPALPSVAGPHPVSSMASAGMYVPHMAAPVPHVGLHLASPLVHQRTAAAAVGGAGFGDFPPSSMPAAFSLPATSLAMPLDLTGLHFMDVTSSTPGRSTACTSSASSTSSSSSAWNPFNDNSSAAANDFCIGVHSNNGTSSSAAASSRGNGRPFGAAAMANAAAAAAMPSKLDAVQIMQTSKLQQMQQQQHASNLNSWGVAPSSTADAMSRGNSSFLQQQQQPSAESGQAVAAAVAAAAAAAATAGLLAQHHQQQQQQLMLQAMAFQQQALQLQQQQQQLMQMNDVAIPAATLAAHKSSSSSSMAPSHLDVRVNWPL